MTNQASMTLFNEEMNAVMKDKFGLNMNEFVKHLEAKENQYNQQNKDWKAYIKIAKEQILNDESASPLQVVVRMQELCNQQTMLDPKKQTLCEKLSEWGSTQAQIVQLLSSIDIVKQIPDEGLEHSSIEKVLALFENSFEYFKHYKAQTSDFMFCDVQRRFVESDFPSENTMDLISQLIDSVNADGEFRKNQLGDLSGSLFGRLNIDTFKILNAANKFKLGCVINTEGCSSSGQHWICIFINIRENQVEMFNSTSDYQDKLVPVKQYCNYVAKQLSIMNQKECIPTFIDSDIQVADSVCGVYCLLYIFCRILNVNPDEIVAQMIKDRSEHLLNLFKKNIFA